MTLEPIHPAGSELSGLPCRIVLAVVALGLTGSLGGLAPLPAQNPLQVTPRESPAAAEPAAGDAETAEGDAAEDEAPQLPPISELVLRSLDVSEEARDDLETIEKLGEADRLRAVSSELSERSEELTARAGELTERSYVSDDHLGQLAAEAGYLVSRVDAALEESSARLEELDRLRAAWLERQALWLRWRESLSEDPQYRTAYADDISEVLARIDVVLGRVDGALDGVVEVQRTLRATAGEARRLHERTLDQLGSWRENLFRRSTPLLFSAEYRARLSPELGRQISRGLSDVAEGLRDGRSSRLGDPRVSGVLLLQVLIALGVGGFARSRRPWVAEDSRWAAVLSHPWSIGVLVAAGTGALLHGPLPPVVRLVVEAVTAFATCRVASGMFRNPFKRRAVYGVSALYVAFATFDAIAFPVPLLRLVLSGLAFAGAGALLVVARHVAGSQWTHQRGFAWLLRLGAAALAVIGIADVLGFHFLAQWLLEASVATAFVVFVVTFLLRLARGSLRAALRTRTAASSPFLSRAGGALVERVIFLLKLLLVTGAALYMATIWNLVPSPGQAWTRFVSAGFTIGEWELTVGRLLTAAGAVYLAFVVSWALRALLAEAFFERRQLERGIKDSISTLLHYVVLVLGFFVALSIFGFDMTNFALIAGALGVGIGFGLQNVVNNFVSGLILLFERPVRVGDVVVVGDVWGTVEKIGLRSTVILTFNGSEMIVPNADLISEKVTNWTLTTPSVRLVMPIGVAYGNDPARVIEVLEEVAKGYPLSLQEPPPAAIFTGFGESSIDFELRVWLGAFEQLLQARSELASALVRRFGEENIAIPFPQRDVHLRRVEEEGGADPRGAPETS